MDSAPEAGSAETNGVGGKVEHYDQNLVWLETLETGVTGFGISQTGMGFDQSGNLYVTNRDELGIFDILLVNAMVGLAIVWWWSSFLNY